MITALALLAATVIMGLRNKCGDDMRMDVSEGWYMQRSHSCTGPSLSTQMEPVAGTQR